LVDAVLPSQLPAAAQSVSGIFSRRLRLFLRHSNRRYTFLIAVGTSASAVLRIGLLSGTATD
jgi:hypothetical protein